MTNDQCLARANGIGGQIEVYGDSVRIIRKAFIETLRGTNDLEIPLSTLSAVRFQSGGLFGGNGFIQLVTAGTKLEASPFDPEADPTRLAFLSAEKKHFEQVKEVLARRIGVKPIPQQPSRNLRAPIGYAIIIALLVSNILRAHFQSITNDEAATYNRYVSQGWNVLLFTFWANNHTLHSILMKITTTIFGVSHLSVRMPALIGGAIYLVSVEYLCRALFRDRLAYVLTFSALTTSPFVLDYLVAARGYGLALGFFMIAVLRCALVLLDNEDAGGRDISNWTCCQLSLLCALSVASNLSFAFVNVALLCVFLLLYLSRGLFYVDGKLEWRVPFTEASQRLFSLTIPGGLMFMAASPNIIHFTRTALYFGKESWRDVYRSLIYALFDDLPAKSTGMFWSELFHWIAGALPLLLGMFIVVGGLLVATKMRRAMIERSQLDGHSKFWLFLFAVLLATIALHSVARLIRGTLLPEERTGLFFVPLGILLTAISIHNLGHAFGQQMLKSAGWFCFPLLIGCFLYSFHVSYFRVWKHDAGSKDVFLVLNSLERDSVHVPALAYGRFLPRA